jgi:hypothetical protein
MKVLTLDLETRPNVVHTWGMYKQDIGLPQLREPGRVISFAAKWYGERPVLFASEYHNGADDMVELAWRLLDEADIVITYNGDNFDIPWLNTEFIKRGMGLPSSFKSIDLYKVVKKNFKFPTNRLAYVTQALGLSGKLKHTGHEMWVDIMEGDEETARKAWNLMRRYNKRDVVTTEELFTALRAYIKLPNPLLYDENAEPDTCFCGGRFHKRGFAYTSVSAYQRYVCVDCGSWFKGGKRIHGVDLRSAL